MNLTGRDRSPRFVTTAMMAITGALFFSAFVLEDTTGGGRDWANLPRGLAVRYLAAMAVGGAIAGWLLAGLFGRRGVLGWLLAVLGGIVASLVAGIFGSAVGLIPDLLADGFSMADLIPIAAGIIIVPLAFGGMPLLIPVWLALIVVTHVWARRARTDGGPRP